MDGNIQKHKTSYLWLLDEGEDMKKNIKSLRKIIVDKNRIIFAERVDRQRHISRIHNIDIALDTLIYNGHTTSIEMIQSGIPLVTLEGKHFASRVSTSLLETLGGSDLITKDIDDYRNIIVNLIEDKSRMERIKEKIIQISKDLNYWIQNFLLNHSKETITSLFK